MPNGKTWLHGLIAAFIGGGANAIVGVISAGWVLPDKVNSGAGLRTALTLMLFQFTFGAILAVAAFLKQSPVPPGWDGADRRANGTVPPKSTVP
jgi:hypothetical protein